MRLGSLWKVWWTFWFQPMTPEPVALFRILFGCLVLQLLTISIGGEFLSWYGINSLVNSDSVKLFFWNSQPRFDLLLAFPNDQSLSIYFYSVILCAVFITVGFCTRISCVYVALAFISMHHHDPFNINGGDAFVRLMLMYLCFSNCGDCYSVDRWIAKKRSKQDVPIVAKAPWALRMMQIQLAIVYLHTFLCKVNGTQWWDGTAVYYATRLEDLMRIQMPLFDNLLFCKSLSWYTLVVEGAMFTLVWVRELRYYVLAAALILHVGIDMAINLPVFEWAFVVSLTLFVEPTDLRSFLERVSRKFRQVAGIEWSHGSKVSKSNEPDAEAAGS